MNSVWARYVGGDPELAPLRPWPWPNPPWEAVLRARRGFPTDRKTLVEALLAQNAPFLAEDPVLQTAIERLRHPKTFTVTTGQQLGWLTGPLYTLIKALHAVQLAQALEEYFQGVYAFVPVFWLASEDHDAAEVCEVSLSWQHRLRYAGTFTGPVGRHRIEPAFPPEASQLPLQRFWEPGRTWEEAFRSAMQALFAGSGLVWLSGDDPRLKSLAAPLWQKEIEQAPTQAAHELALAYLRSLGEKPRLHAQPCNLFWLSDTERRYPTPEERTQLQRAAYLTPERLSPNVLLRPLYQEVILPNIAYVAGPAEIAYWLELAPVFAAFEVFMPVLYPRGHLRISWLEPPPLPPNLQPADLWNYPLSRLRSFLAEQWSPNEAEALLAWWQAHTPPVEELRSNPLLRRPVARFQHFWQRWGRELRRAAQKAAYHAHRTSIEAALTYRQTLEPEGRLQERTLNLHAFAPTDPVGWVQRLRTEVKLQPGAWTFWQMGPLCPPLR